MWICGGLNGNNACRQSSTPRSLQRSQSATCVVVDAMAFWVYENTIHKKARIHEAACSFCVHGQGLHGSGKTSSGEWHGPFEELETATSAATQTKQPDIRGCSVCIGGVAGNFRPAGEQRPTQSAVTEAEPVDLDWKRELNCSLFVRWISKGRIALDEGGRPIFPSVEKKAGLYRLAARYPDGRFAAYVGESVNLHQRFGYYRNPGPTQQTSQRINAWLKELLSDGGDVSVSVAEQTHLDGKNADLSKKATRRMFEQMAIALEHAKEIESLNR